MARQRRGGFRPPELKGTLGTLLRTTLQQAGVMREVIQRGAREGRSRLDDALSQRKRHDSLIELGEIVLDLIRRGEIVLDELPEIAEVVAHLDGLDAGHTPDHDEPVSPRGRFDQRKSKPPARGISRIGDDDGTVSAAETWVPPGRPKTQTKVWRPPVERPTAPPEDIVENKQTLKTGGISFEDDDLADYMHPDDVPPKGES